MTGNFGQKIAFLHLKIKELKIMLLVMV